MPGFIFIKGSLKNDFLDYKNEKLLVETLEYDDIKIQRRTIKKFLDDKIFYQDENFLIVTEGVIFNKFELIKKYKKENFKDTIIEMYKKNGDTFFNEFRGSFSGIFIEKLKDKILIFTDQIGTKKLYYYDNIEKIKESFILGSDFYEVLNLCKHNKLDYFLNKIATYSLLTYGSMIENFTLVKEIKFLKAGQYVKVENKKIEILRYHKIKKQKIEEKTKEEIIEKIDLLFKQAVKRQYEKNKEYGYLNMAPLSAGLDSRTTNFVLNKLLLPEENIINITYSQNDYRDEKIPKIIAKDLKNHWIFKSLNNGLSMMLMEEVNKITYGTVFSAGAAQVLDIIKFLDFEKIGVIHTGMFGECLAGGEAFDKEITISSTKLISKINKNEIFFEEFDKFEIFNFYNSSTLRSFMGAPKIFQEVTESFSPFYDIDFIQYTINIPREIRQNHNIYDRWLLKKYPNACKYLSNGRKIGGKTIKILGRTVPLNEILKRVVNFCLRKVDIKKESINSENHMNPLDLWYGKNENLKRYFDDLYDRIIPFIKEEDIKKDCKILYLEGNTIEKDLVLTFLIAYKNIFNN